MLKKDKPAELQRVKELIEQYQVVGIVNMHSMPARQLQGIRRKLAGKGVIRMTKTTLLRRALEQSTKKNVQQLLPVAEREVALLLSNENPFKLFLFLKQNRAPATAKAGQIAAKEIVIPKGPTPLPPGPAISALQKLALKTTVQGGKIAVSQDKVVAKPGDVITVDMVSVFSLLKIEPMEIGLNLVAAWENEYVFFKDVLNIDIDAMLRQMQAACQHAVSLSIASGYLTDETAPLAIMKAFLEAKSLAITASFMTSDTVHDIMMAAVRGATALQNVIPIASEESEKKEVSE